MTRISAKHKLSGASGFTLIELMVVVAIVALVSAAVVPSFSLALQRERQRTVANYVVQSVFAARSRAVRTGRCHRVTVTMGQPGITAGTGGLVVVEEYLRGDTCSTAAADGEVNNWNSVYRKPVATLVGGDVAIANARVEGADVGPGSVSPEAVSVPPVKARIFKGLV